MALRRCRVLLEAGARVTVVAPELVPGLDSLVTEGVVALHRREVRDDDLDAVDGEALRLVVVATDDPAANERVGRAAASRGVLVNRADDGGAGDVSFPSTLRRGPLTVAVATGGASPVAARWVAERLDEQLDAVLGLDAAGLTMLVEVLAEVRRERAAAEPSGQGPHGPEERGVTVGAVDWRSALDGSILDLIHQGRRAEAKERLLACLSS